MAESLAERAAAVLREHPGVLAVDAREDEDGVRATVTPRSGYASGAQVAKWSERRVSGWQLVWERDYSTAPPPADPTLNLATWLSSFDLARYPESSMREWIDDRVARIAALRPRRLLEIGCGLGLLAHRVAPLCESYTGIDFSASAVAQLRAHAPPNVTVFERAAHELDGLPPFDTAVINSVVQYFPDLEYLERVVLAVVARLPAGGALFVGDVRSLQHLRALHAEIAFRRADDAVTREALAARVDDATAREGELDIDARWFRSLADRVERIATVEVRLERGSATEMALFRYDVILRVGSRPPLVDARELRWPALPKRDAGPERIRGAPNQRLLATARLVRWLAGEGDARTVGEFRRARAAEVALPALNPDEALASGGCVDWSSSGAFDEVDVTYAPPDVHVAPPPYPALVGPAATDPLRPIWLRHVRPELEARLRAALGDEASRVRLVVDAAR